MEEDDSTLNKLMSGLRGSVKSLVKSTVDETIGLPKEAAQIKQSLGVLTKFNDPKGQYLYCLNAVVLNNLCRLKAGEECSLTSQPKVR